MQISVFAAIVSSKGDLKFARWTLQNILLTAIGHFFLIQLVIQVLQYCSCLNFTQFPGHFSKATTSSSYPLIYSSYRLDIRCDTAILCIIHTEWSYINCSLSLVWHWFHKYLKNQVTVDLTFSYTLGHAAPGWSFTQGEMRRYQQQMGLSSDLTSLVYNSLPFSDSCSVCTSHTSYVLLLPYLRKPYSQISHMDGRSVDPLTSSLESQRLFSCWDP